MENHNGLETELILIYSIVNQKTICGVEIPLTFNYLATRSSVMNDTVQEKYFCPE